MDIDIVILWVDGSDPAWQAQKRKYLPPEEKDSNSANRYRDWGLLPYWFRAVEKFAPWVRKVHFVTWGHVPDFLNLDAPKLHVVRHEDFIPPKYLPTFSSHAIEMNIHRIPGLAEHFIYFNDDMFLLQPMAETDFFRDGLPCTYGGEEPWVFNGDVGVWAHAAANNLGVINRHFPKRAAVASHGRKYLDKQYRWKDNVRTFLLQKLFPDHFTGFRNLHAPGAYRKQTFEQVWQAEPALLDSTSSHKFRMPSDVNQWVCLWWQVASGNFSPYVTDNAVMSTNEETVAAVCRTIEEQTYAMICVNDPEGDVDAQALAMLVRRSFEALLPEKCAFEK